MKEEKNKFNLDKILYACGFIGPIIFFFTIYFLFALFYPGYDIANQTISELGETDSPVKMFANVFGFSLFGIFIMLFAYGIFRSERLNIFSRISSIFFFFSGVFMYFVGIFHSQSNYSTMAVLHNIASNYQFPILALGLVIFAFSISSNEKLKWLTPVILLFGIITLILAYYFFFTIDLQNRGIWQRFAIGIPYTIMAIIAVSLYRIEK